MKALAEIVASCCSADASADLYFYLRNGFRFVLLNITADILYFVDFWNFLFHKCLKIYGPAIRTKKDSTVASNLSIEY